MPTPPTQPPYGPLAQRKADVDPEQAANKILALWMPPLAHLDWPDRLALIEEIDEDIIGGCEDDAICRRVSQIFTQKFIDHLDDKTVACREQAIIYLNSNYAHHRQAGRIWLVLHEPESSLLDDGERAPQRPGMDRRRALRHRTDLPGIIDAQDQTIQMQMVDISADGACLRVDNPPGTGTRVLIELPFLGRIAASVVWVATASIGLAFLTDQASAIF